MNQESEKELQRLLKESMAPVTDTELRRDLWPEMLKKLDEQESARVPWFDWVLAAILGAAVFLFPAAIPALLYHL